MRVTDDPYCQGDLDSLCGLYAIINALCALCPEIDEEIATAIFRHLVRHGSEELDQLLPAASHGISRDGLRRLLRASIKYVGKHLGITIEQQGFAIPERRLSLDAVWRLAEEELDGQSVLILLTRGAQHHWTVAHAATRCLLRLIDSNGRRVLVRSRCTVKDTKTRFQLAPDDMTLLRRTGPW